LKVVPARQAPPADITFRGGETQAEGRARPSPA
jgi:hypothetical protein